MEPLVKLHYINFTKKYSNLEGGVLPALEQLKVYNKMAKLFLDKHPQYKTSHSIIIGEIHTTLRYSFYYV